MITHANSILDLAHDIQWGIALSELASPPCTRKNIEHRLALNEVVVKYSPIRADYAVVVSCDRCEQRFEYLMRDDFSLNRGRKGLEYVGLV